MVTLIFATNNLHKVAEWQASIGEQVKLITLEQAGITIDIPEPHDTLKENATEKARTIYQLTHEMDCFSEDSGLEVDALEGAPGVRSARYAGPGKSASDNIDKLLNALVNKADRQARFRTVISLMLNHQEFFFEGICEGKIIAERRGDHGFGYDPVFVPDGSSKTFAEMTMGEKSLYSHRKKAADKLVRFLDQQKNTAHAKS